MKQKLTEKKGEIDNSTITAGDSNTHFQQQIKQLGRRWTKKKDLNDAVKEQTSTEKPT